MDAEIRTVVCDPHAALCMLLLYVRLWSLTLVVADNHKICEQNNVRGNYKSRNNSIRDIVRNCTCGSQNP